MYMNLSYKKGYGTVAIKTSYQILILNSVAGYWNIFFFCPQVSYFEIYLDKIRDLLDGKYLGVKTVKENGVAV